VARFDGAMPTGVTVSRSGRVFVNFPRWGDPVPFTVAEVKEGKPVAYPDEAINREPGADVKRAFVSVQSVVVDPADRLWVLDTGNPMMKGVVPDAPKLVGIDLTTNRIVKTIPIPADVALPTTYLNDVRFDLRKGTGGVAYITDSSADGPNGIVVVDLDSGASWRRLHDHPSTRPEKGFLPLVEGRDMWLREPGKERKRVQIGSDGIAIGADGAKLYYCPLASRKLYAVNADLLSDRNASDADVAASVEDLGEKGAADGMESDAQGRIYVTAYEQNAVLRRNTDGTFETLLHDPSVLWPDTLALAEDGWLYVVANQLHRQPQYHDGRDERVKPYLLLRVKTDGTPVRLAAANR
jgi:sugar lactone lactonase YvrE